MKLVDERSYDYIRSLIKNDVEKCLYVYLNLVNYKKENSQISVYVDDINDISVIMVEYHNSFQVYKRKDISEIQTEEIRRLFCKKKPKMISGSSDLIESIHDGIKDIYNLKHGGIFIENRFRSVMCDDLVKEASEKDANDIAKLIALDNGLGSHYDIRDLEEQLRNRIKSRTGRSYVIYDGGVIVAHTATYAECNGIAVVSGTIIHPDYREKNYYLLLSNYMISKLKNEGKKIYTFVADEKLYKYHLKMHDLCGEYARMKLKGE